jgi:two-component system sensor histidine kinase BaeS
MRMTIARKIAVAVVAIVVLCVGTMAWVTSANLQRGFIDYMNEMQAEDLDDLGRRIATRYSQEGNWEWLRHRPRALRELLDQMSLTVMAEPAGGFRRQPPEEGPDGRVRPPPRDGEGPEGRRPPDDRRPPPREGDDMEGRRPPPEGDDDGNRPPPRDGANMDGPRPPRDGDQRPPPREGDGYRGRPPGPGENFPAAPGQPGPDDRPQRGAPPGARDPMGFASRVSIYGLDGRPILGPPDAPPGLEHAIMLEGEKIAVIRLRPLQVAAGANANATGFLEKQVHAILWLALVLIGMSVLLAMMLARHLLRPVAALRDVTGRIAKGDLEARAPLMSQDELAELALHVNAMAESLEQNERQRRRMVADISHELRTPLTVIRGEIEALLDGIRQADPGALESLHAEVLRLNKLVEDLHQLTLADAGGLSYHWNEVDLAELLDPVFKRFQPRAESVGLSLKWKLAEGDVVVKADPDRLTQVVVNLLENSVRYTDAPGRIEASLVYTANKAELVIEDSSPSAPPEDLPHLFDRLYRVDNARTRSLAKGGSGLGLAICKALVEAHGGTIEAMESRLGGVCMLITLPTLAE